MATRTASCQVTVCGGRIQPDSMDEYLMNIAKFPTRSNPLSRVCTKHSLELGDQSS
jgi:hypothetical protein